MRDAGGRRSTGGMATLPSVDVALVSRPGRRPALGLAVLLPALVVLAYALPFYGFLASVLVPAVAHAQRERLWPGVRRAASTTAAFLVWFGLWSPGLLALFVPFLLGGGAEGTRVDPSTLWLVLPLCGPDTVAAILVPALAAGGVAFAGLAVSVTRNRPAVWVVAAWVAPWAHHLVFTELAPAWVC